MTKRNTFCDPHLADQKPAFSVLQATKLPEIPLPSSRLQNLLCQYQFDDISEKKKATQSQKNNNQVKREKEKDEWLYRVQILLFENY